MQVSFQSTIFTKGPSRVKLECAFFLSFYLSMAMAAICLGYIAFPANPFEVGLLAVPLTLLYGLAYRAEGRRTIGWLTATLLGTLIAAGAGLWLAEFFIALPAAERASLTWPAQLLPRIGYVLLFLVG